MTQQMLPLNMANSWVEIFAFAGVLIGGVWALLQWRRSIQDRRSHMLFEMLKFYFESRIYDTFTTYIDHPRTHLSEEEREFWTGLKFYSPEVEQKIDEMLLFFSNVCYQKKKGFLPRNEGTIFRYQLVQILSDSQIRDYMAWLKDYAKESYPFGELDDYAKRSNIHYENSKKEQNPEKLTNEVLEKYLIQHFGSLTDSARSVKSRVKTIMKITGCELHELVKDERMFTECMEKIEKDADSNNAVKSNLRNALRHCYSALHKDEMHK
jgi:ribosomal protein S20